MTKRMFNTLLVLIVTLLVTGAGYYQVEVQQPRELQRIEEAKKAARLQEAEFEQLFIEEASSAEKAEEMTRRWHARYKYIPPQLRTPDIVKYLQELSTRGFEQFAYRHTTQGSTPDYSFHTFEISGTATYRDLYRFIWELESNRAFYQVSNLDVAHTNVFKTNQATGERRRMDMVGFSMSLKAFFAGTEGLSAPEGDLLPEVPESLFPARTLPHDSFYPIVRTDLPPNDELLLDIEKATLLSIAGMRAFFQDKHGQHLVQQGDKIYLGEITKVDPLNMRVQARLNKGGAVELFDVTIDIDPAYRQAQQEDTRLVPTEHR